MNHDGVTFTNVGSIPRGYAVGNRTVLEECISELVTEAKRVIHTVPRRPKKNVLRFVKLFTGCILKRVFFVQNNAG